MSVPERTQYASSILVSQRPIDATEIVRVRLSQAKLLNDEFANFFKKYHTLKSNYLHELNNLVKTSENLNKNIESAIISNQVLTKDELKHYNVDAIGNLSEIWSEVVQEIRDEISANYQLNKVVGRDVIEQLESYTTRNKSWSDVRTMHSKLSEVAQNIEFSEDKLEKYGSNPAKNQDKIHKYESILKNSNSTWDSQAPYVFEAFETTDFQRLQFLRDNLLRFQTAYSDALNKISTSTEKTLSTILNFNPETEIQRFAKVSSENKYIPKDTRKAAEASPVIPQDANNYQKQRTVSENPRSDSSFGNRQVSTATNATTATTATNATAATNATNATAVTAATNATATTSTTTSTDSPASPSKSSRFRLGGSKSKNPSNKLRSRVGSIFGRKKRNDKELNIDESLPESEASSLPGSPSKDLRLNSTESPVNSSAIGTSNHGNSANNDSGNQKQTHPKDSMPPQYSQHQVQHPSNLPYQPQPIDKDTAASTSSHPHVPFSLNQEPLKPTSRSNSSVNLNAKENKANGSSSLNDASVPPFQSTQQPIAASPFGLNETSHAESLDHHRAPPPPPSRKTGPFGSQNLSNIREDADASFSEEHHQHSHPQGAVPAVGRRDIQSGLFTNLSQADLENNQGKRISSFNSFGGDSIRQLRPQSTGSTLNVASSLFQHPELTSPGLNASIAEVINAKFKDGEQISSQLIGEIAFNYQSSGFDIPTRTNVKIQGAENFDKIIPNNQLLKQVDQNEFEISPASILSRTIGGLKYSIKSPLAPIVIIPAWRFEPHQASAMLTIKLSPHIVSKLRPGESIQINDFVVSVAVAGNVTTGALSKPQGTFNREKSRIVWKFKEPVLLSATNEKRLVARFLTTSLTKESEQGVIVKFTIDNNNGGSLAASDLELSCQNFSEDDPFNQEPWSLVPSFKSVVAGNYAALS